MDFYPERHLKPPPEFASSKPLYPVQVQSLMPAAAASDAKCQYHGCLIPGQTVAVLKFKVKVEVSKVKS